MPWTSRSRPDSSNICPRAPRAEPRLAALEPTVADLASTVEVVPPSAGDRPDGPPCSATSRPNPSPTTGGRSRANARPREEVEHPGAPRRSFRCTRSPTSLDVAGRRCCRLRPRHRRSRIDPPVQRSRTDRRSRRRRRCIRSWRSPPRPTRTSCRSTYPAPPPGSSYPTTWTRVPSWPATCRCPRRAASTTCGRWSTTRPCRSAATFVPDEYGHVATMLDTGVREAAAFMLTVEQPGAPYPTTPPIAEVHDLTGSRRNGRQRCPYCESEHRPEPGSIACPGPRLRDHLVDQHDQQRTRGEPAEGRLAAPG